MSLLVFPQYAKLITHFRAVAYACAAEKARWPICRVDAQNGAAHLHGNVMNVHGQNRFVRRQITSCPHGKSSLVGSSNATRQACESEGPAGLPKVHLSCLT